MLDQNKNNKLTQSLICLCKKQKLVYLKPNLLKCEICLREFKKEKNIYKFLNKIAISFMKALMMVKLKYSKP